MNECTLYLPISIIRASWQWQCMHEHDHGLATFTLNVSPLSSCFLSLVGVVVIGWIVMASFFPMVAPVPGEGSGATHDTGWGSSSPQP